MPVPGLRCAKDGTLEVVRRHKNGEHMTQPVAALAAGWGFFGSEEGANLVQAWHKRAPWIYSKT